MASSSSGRGGASSLTSQAESVIADAEEEPDRERAISNVVQVAETAMDALRQAPDNQREDIKQTLNQLLTKAESIKRASQWPPKASQSTRAVEIVGMSRIEPMRRRRTEAPQSTRELSRSEELLLWRNSKLHGFKFPPRQSPPEPKHFMSKEGDVGENEHYVDTPDLPLSAQQLQLFAGWKHARDALHPSVLVDANLATMTARNPIDLVQDVVTDCSVVASLCAAVAREQTHENDKLLYKLIYPQNGQGPIFSENGKYIVRLNFNGCYRYVTIDDRLPTSKTSRMLHVIDRHNPGLVWPALLEKAYLKVRGGYDFRGSNPGTDLWILLGWIPEQIPLQDDEVNFDDVWIRVKELYGCGEVLITAGTGSMSNVTERTLGLASKHAYAVLDVKEEDGKKLVLFKNPWSDRGPIDRTGVRSVTEDEDLLSWDDNVNASPNDRAQQTPAANESSFWMEARELLQHFESIYLNWDPRLFSYREDIHFSWAYGATEATGDSQVHNPQFIVKCAPGFGPLWLLLCRHFCDDTGPSNNASGNGLRTSNGYIGLDIYNNGGDRVDVKSSAIKEGYLVDSPQTLLRLDRVDNLLYTVVIQAKGLPLGDHSFTLSAFGNSHITLGALETKAEQQYEFATSLNSAWTTATAGGNSQSSNYFVNPQFRLSTSLKCDLSLSLETDSKLNVNLKLVHSGGKRIFKMTGQDVITDSGDYRAGGARATIQGLDPGSYTVICSTFASGQEAAFMLRVRSTANVELSLLPSELAGRFLYDKLPYAIFYPNDEKMALHIVPVKPIKLSIIAKRLPSVPSSRDLVPVDPHTPLRLTIDLGHGPNKHTLAVSGRERKEGEYEDSSEAIRINDIDLLPQWRNRGDFWLVLDRLSAPASGEIEKFKVDLLCDGRLGEELIIGQWRTWND